MCECAFSNIHRLSLGHYHSRVHRRSATLRQSNVRSRARALCTSKLPVVVNGCLNICNFDVIATQKTIHYALLLFFSLLLQLLFFFDSFASHEAICFFPQVKIEYLKEDDLLDVSVCRYLYSRKQVNKIEFCSFLFSLNANYMASDYNCVCFFSILFVSLVMFAQFHF